MHNHARLQRLIESWLKHNAGPFGQALFTSVDEDNPGIPLSSGDRHLTSAAVAMYMTDAAITTMKSMAAVAEIPTE